MRDPLPDWCRFAIGTAPVIIVAPHGGRRPPDAGRRGARVNDLHTAALAEELAGALGAGLLINTALDRNLLDLNRISQIAARAPWFAAALEHLLGAALARHARVELLVVHGWNAVQPRCDLGIGARLADPAAFDAGEPTVTVSADYVATRLAALRAACARAGIATAFGARYPGRHPNNLLQLFRRGTPHPAAATPIADWVAAGRIEAVQLELGIPLRWPGADRERFVTALRSAFDEPTPRVRTRRRPPSAAPANGITRPLALQAYDPAADIGVSARLDPLPDGIAARLLLFLGRERVALFTGDAAAADAATLLPRLTAEPDGLRLRFRGALIATDDGRRYVDLEDALAASQLLTADVDLHLTGGLYGPVRGALTLDGRRVRFAGDGFARPASGVFGGTPRWLTSLTLHAGFGGGEALQLRHTTPGGLRLERLAPTRTPVGPVHALAIRFDDDATTPQQLAVRADGSELVAEPIARMAVVRPLGPGRAARVTFGVARVAFAGRTGFGFYEYGRVLGGAPRRS